jgi:hypothetical protein
VTSVVEQGCGASLTPCKTWGLGGCCHRLNAAASVLQAALAHCHLLNVNVCIARDMSVHDWCVQCMRRESSMLGPEG